MQSAMRSTNRVSRSGSANRGCSCGASALTESVEVQLSHQMSLLVVPTDGETLPELNHEHEGEYYVVQAYASGLKRTVVERQNNILSIDEVRRHQAECDKAMMDELQRWHNLKAFERMPKALSHNVVDSRWVLKWKEVGGKRVIHARLVVRGFKDHQATQLNTFAGTTSRWGQRVVNSVAAQSGWEIFTADVSQAFLRGLTFEQTAEMKDEVRREEQFTIPPGSADMLKKLPGFENFNAMLEVLRLLRCGFGLKDAPRLWSKLLTEELKKIGLKPLQSDPQLFVWHVNEPAVVGSGWPQTSSSGGTQKSRAHGCHKMNIFLHNLYYL